MIRTTMIGVSCALLLSGAALAAEPGLVRPAFLPPDVLVNRALDVAPNVLEAQAMLASSKSEARVLSVGDYETTVTAGIDNRRIRGEGGMSEWSLQLARPVRLPGKGLLDRKAGAAGVSAAEGNVEDARHQLSLGLVRLWTEWLQAVERQAVDADELAGYQKDLAALSRRVALKDASRLEQELMRAATARAEAALNLSTGAAQAAKAELDAQFPGLAPVRPAPMGDPAAPGRAFDLWPELILKRSHEISIVRDLADREDLLARRAGLDRTPDPVVGVRTFNERGGAESGVGVFVSIPFSGGRRAAVADRQIANASAARVRLVRMEREVRATAQRDVIQARTGLAAWSGAYQALAQTRTATELVRRAYQLGERDLSELLLAERQLFEARRAELDSRTMAHQAVLKLALDAHELWLSEE
jgi:outer membrane protein TolC